VEQVNSLQRTDGVLDIFSDFVKLSFDYNLKISKFLGKKEFSSIENTMLQVITSPVKLFDKFSI